MITGKLVGGALGYMAAGPFGAVVGLAAGHFFDKGVGRAMGFDDNGERERLRQLFFETTFGVIGHLAKADGRVCEDEVAQTEALIVRLNLSSDHRQQAIQLFKAGTEANFDLQAVMSKFISEGGRNHNLPAMLIEFLVVVAMADGELDPAEKDVLMRTASYLGFNTRQFQRMLDMLIAQESFGHDYQQRGAPARADELVNAYKALGIESSISDKDLKRAYRKLMSQHHPDKLIAQGVPEDMLKVATEKAQEIQVAYDLIKKSRG